MMGSTTDHHDTIFRLLLPFNDIPYVLHRKIPLIIQVYSPFSAEIS